MEAEKTALSDADSSVRLVAAEALARNKDDLSRELIIGRIQLETDPSVRNRMNSLVKETQ